MSTNKYYIFRGSYCCECGGLFHPEEFDTKKEALDYLEKNYTKNRITFEGVIIHGKELNLTVKKVEIIKGLDLK